MKYGVEAKTFDLFDVGTVASIYFYPKGREKEPEIKIDLPITKEFCPEGCNRWTLYLTIYDDRFEYTTPHGVERTYRRM